MLRDAEELTYQEIVKTSESHSVQSNLVSTVAALSWRRYSDGCKLLGQTENILKEPSLQNDPVMIDCAEFQGTLADYLDGAVGSQVRASARPTG
jgi:hypothetical protein